MGSLRIRRPSPALVISVIALIAAVGGSAYAAIAKNSVGSKQLKRGAVKTSDIKNSAVTGAKVKESTLSEVPNSANSGLLGGSPASAFAPASTIRTASVDFDGTVVAAESDGVTQANVTHAGEGIYCVNGLSPAPRSVAVSMREGSLSEVQPAIAEIAPTSFCIGSQIGVVTITNGNATFSDQPFTVFIH
jgi:hypothetical protein